MSAPGFAGLRPNYYRTIAVDPPWKFKVRSEKGEGRSPDQHYNCMSLDDLKALPVANLAARDCALFLWVTDPLLDVGIDVLKSWGFAYKTVAFTWVKLNKLAPSEGWGEGDFFTSLGYWTRANSELCLLGTRGNPKRLAKNVRRLLVAPRREHSRKPDEAYRRMLRLTGGPACELFARTRRGPEWDCWGHEVDKFLPSEKIPRDSVGVEAIDSGAGRCASLAAIS